MRIMGLDFGTKTCGVSISDPLLLTAQGMETITRERENHLRQTLARIEELILVYQVNLIVLGYPKHMDASLGERAKQTEKFAEDLKRRTGLQVVLWDERLTTVEAERYMKEDGLDFRKRKKKVDRLAATLILQNYLDYRAMEHKVDMTGKGHEIGEN